MNWLPFLLLGAATHGVQTVLLRELLALSNGSEPAVAFGLAGWLVVALLGSLFGDWLARCRRVSSRLRQWTSTALLAAPPAALLGLLAARFVKFLAPVEPGNPLPLPWIGAISLCAGGVPALVSGVSFPLLLACRRPAGGAFRDPEEGGLAYCGDALGMALAGALLSFLLLGLVPGFGLAWCLACLPAFGVLALTSPGRWQWRGGLSMLAALGLLGAIAATFLDRRTREWLWQHYHHSPMALIQVEEAPHGVVETVAYGSAVSIYRDGLLDLSLPDEQSRDDSAHVAMLQVEMPGSVLLVNSVLGAGLWHVLSHRPAAVQCLDSPPDLVPSLRERMCRHQVEALGSAPVSRAVADPLDWLRDCDRRFAVVIVRIPDPLSLGAARTCSVEFIRAVWSKVAEGGILAFGPIPGGGPLGGGQFLERNRTIHDTFLLATGRADVTGNAAPWLLACRGARPINLDPMSLWHKAKDRGIRGFSPVAACHDFGRARNGFELRYGTPYNPLVAAPSRIPPPSVSSLSTPRVAAQTFQAWLGASKDGASRLFAVPGRASLWWWFALAPVLPALLLLRRHRRLPCLVLGTYASGFWSALVSWGVLCAFQAAHGSLFQYLAVINGAHMLGMGLAATAFSRPHARRLPLFLGLTMASVGTLLWLRAPASGLPFWAAVSLGAMAGMLPGASFAVASGAPSARGLPGTLYAADLAGGLAGFVIGVCVLFPQGVVRPPAVVLAVPVLVALALLGDLRQRVS